MGTLAARLLLRLVRYHQLAPAVWTSMFDEDSDWGGVPQTGGCGRGDGAAPTGMHAADGAADAKKALFQVGGSAELWGSGSEPHITPVENEQLEAMFEKYEAMSTSGTSKKHAQPFVRPDRPAAHA
eukprot:3246303-Pleurochrysis_carterae.AAC.1